MSRHPSHTSVNLCQTAFSPTFRHPPTRTCTGTEQGCERPAVGERLHYHSSFLTLLTCSLTWHKSVVSSVSVDVTGHSRLNIEDSPMAIVPWCYLVGALCERRSGDTRAQTVTFTRLPMNSSAFISRSIDRWVCEIYTPFSGVCLYHGVVFQLPALFDLSG